MGRAVRNSMLNQSSEETRRSNHQRERRTNRMLITISMVFCFCWLPLNLIGALMDADPYLFGSATDTMNIIFMTCHIIGMCSACINPVIYGFCNETIRTELGGIRTKVVYATTKLLGWLKCLGRRSSTDLSTDFELHDL